MKIVLAMFVASGCAFQEPPLVNLSEGGLAVYVTDAPPDPLQFDLSLLAQPAQCLELRSSITLTLNGMSGTFSNGSYDDVSEDSCSYPWFQIAVIPRPLTLDVVFDDGTAQLHVGLAVDQAGYYETVTRCDFANCNAEP